MYSSAGCLGRGQNLRGERVGFFLIFSAAVLCFADSARAIVLHPDVEEPSVKPDSDVVGRWRTNASCVAIGRANWYTTGYILTTRHQGGGSVGDSVWFGGVAYRIDQVWNAPQVDGYSPDLRVCRITRTDGGKANLLDFVLWNSSTNEVGQSIVLGGYGKGRKVEDPYPEGYYNWYGLNNQTLRWGQNTIDGVQSNFYSSPYRSDVVRLDFDGPASQDAAIAEWDSGGGWFYQDEGRWVVAGLSAYVDSFGYSRYSPTSDRNWAVRVSSYASWIDSIVPLTYEPSIPGDANLDGLVDSADYTIWADNYTGEGGTGKTWITGDFNFDGSVDSADYTIWADHYGAAADFPMIPVPEPASSGLLLAALMATVAHRKPARK